MRSLLPLALVGLALPVSAQITVNPKILEGPPPGTEEARPASPPVNPQPTQLLRCPDGKGGVALQDRPCKAAAEAPATTPVSEVTDLSQLAPRPRAEPPTPPAEPAAPSRWTVALHGAGKLAVLLAVLYGVFWIGRHARDRYRQRFPAPEAPSRTPHRIR